MADTMTVEILEDGTIKVSTGKVSAVNHASADEFLRMANTLAGGDVTRTRRTNAHHHTHNHTTDKETN